MNYLELTAVPNLFQAWSEFKKGKKKRADLQLFERNLEDNLFSLQKSLADKTYRHGGYEEFYVNDPKRRHIHKANIADRIVHHLLYKYLYGLFDKTFIYDSYSCRLEKGTHRAVKRLEKFARIVSKNYTASCWALKCDIRKFFATVDHQILLALLQERVLGRNIFDLLKEVIASFPAGIPLGNLTSQVFANIYLNELDQFVKNQLKVKYYLRYADDFVLLSSDKARLTDFAKQIKEFLQKNLKMELHPKKVIYRKLDWGIDFLGYVVLPHHVLPRTKTKRRAFRKATEKSLPSYLGYLSHANSYRLQERLRSQVLREFLEKSR